MSADRVPRRVLMIAFHFPPLRGSSGIQRTLRFVQHLPKSGWEPLVLTASQLAYEETSDDQLADLAPGLVVERAFALNAARHLALFGRYPTSLALPDRWASWRFAAVAAGMRMIRRYRPDVIWSTYPIATAHLIGAQLAAKSGLPWVADFRDPMAQDGYPAEPRAWQSFRRIEESTLRLAKASVFTTPGCATFYRSRYPDITTSKFAVIENGYDEQTFSTIEARTAGRAAPGGDRRFVLLHSGIIYPSERDPTQLFVALGRLKKEGAIDAATFCLRLRASANDAMLSTLANENDVADLVSLEPPIAYQEALDEMLRVDGLLILQAANCNDQVPAKVYEYIRARRPVLALTDPVGDTASALTSAGLRSIAPLDDAVAIAAALQSFLGRARAGHEPLATAAAVADCSREGRTRRLAALFDRIC